MTNLTHHTFPVLRRALGPLLLLATGLIARAQSAPISPPATGDQTVGLEAFVTVGTRFDRRTVTDSAVPIDVLTQKEIRQGGYTETAKILQAQIPSFNNLHPTTPDGNTHIRSATLRGLSPDQTLVLVNGKRRHTSAWVNTGGTIGRGAVSTDLNAILRAPSVRSRFCATEPRRNMAPMRSRARSISSCVAISAPRRA